MAAGVEICAARFIPESMLLNCSLVITVWQGPALPEASIAEPVFVDAASLGHTPGMTTTGAFGATLSGLNCCGNGGAGCWVAGRRESGCAGGVPGVWANAHVPARRVVKKSRNMNERDLPQR